MKVTLQIKARENTMRDIIGGPVTHYDACLLSASKTPDGKRSRLMFPGVIQSSDNAKKLARTCLAHLIQFGFDKVDITIERL